MTIIFYSYLDTNSFQINIQRRLAVQYAMALLTSTKLVSVQLNQNTIYPISQSSLKPPQKASFNPPSSISNFRIPLYNQLHVTSSAISSSNEVGSVIDSESVISELDRVRVFDLNGNGIPITDLWKDRTAVVAFARHFGCVFCRKRADYLASKKAEMDTAGVALVVIGPGSIDQAKAFYEQTKFKGEVYADPEHSSYEALRFVSGVSTTFTPKAGLKIIQLYMEGYRQDWGLSFQKDTVSRGGWQQGGIIVAGPGRTNFSYIHKDKEAGDDPPIDDILRACCNPINV
ncbi:hypothetical protein RND81_05G042300 [Saponaria officinalis]|uniref:Thioredoxin-like protein AAED1, chloroplastic n=1 Tax=Saponaria officinalis TaxID=3572 RepID=A0AAW1KQM7_SAPOF